MENNLLSDPFQIKWQMNCCKLTWSRTKSTRLYRTSDLICVFSNMLFFEIHQKMYLLEYLLNIAVYQIGIDLCQLCDAFV